MKKMVAISGSLRKESYNIKLLNIIKEKFSNQMELKILDIADLPLFNEDIENNNIDTVNYFKSSIKESEGIIIATPEYNYSISGVLKNAIDWASRGEDNSFANKKVAIVSASLSFLGGVRAQNHLREILLCLNANVIRKPEIFIGEVHKKFDNNMFDEKLDKFIDDLISELLR